MNYFVIYNLLCERGKSERNLDYSESHHIVPSCMGGSDDESNRTRLTAREHYVAHRLLTKMYPKNHRILHAFGMMAVVAELHNREYTSHQYSLMKTARSDAMKISNPSKTDAGRKRISEMAKERAAAGFNPMYLESAKKKISDRMKVNNPNKGGVTNPRAKPIRVHYEDGTVEEYKYGKQFSEMKAISYATVKTLIRKKTRSPKYQIRLIEQIEKDQINVST